MANQYVNKVEYGNDTLIDLTSDTVTAEDLANGVTAHDRSGAPIVGTGMGGHTIIDASGTDMTARAGLQFLNANVTDDSTNDKTIVSTNAGLIPATDTENLLGGGAGATSTTQALLDEIAYRVADKLLTKTAASSLYLPQSVQNVVGCKNLLSNTAATKTENGLTFTVNADGSVNVNGTASANTWFYLSGYKYRPYPTGNYIASSEQTTGDNTVGLWVDGYSNSSGTWAKTIAKLTGQTSSKECTIDYSNYDYINAYIYVSSGTTFTNKLFKPMLRPASYKDSTYEPYAMTNRELTAVRTGTVTPETNSYSAVNTSYSSLFACGKIGVIQCYLAVSSASPNSTWIKVATMSEQAAKENIIQVQEFKNGGNLNGIQFKLDGNSIYARPMVTGNYQLNASFIIK